MPGVEMSLEEQEGVVRELEGEVGRLEAVVERIRARARELVVEGGMEG